MLGSFLEKAHDMSKRTADTRFQHTSRETDLSKELKISIGIALPDDLFEQAKVLTAVKPLWEEFMDALEATEIGATVEHALDVPPVARKPRKARAPKMVEHSLHKAA